MASFTPLNVEPGDSSDEELDFTKELQIEEALKTYHHALKLHSQGPNSYDEAEAAYKELFKSEIFDYPEGLSSSRQLELYGEDESSDEKEDSSIAPDPSNRNDGAPNSLPQILYLSYKNHAQLVLDIVQNRLRDPGVQPSDSTDSDIGSWTHRALTRSLSLMVEAVARDETDLFLWRQISRISSYLGSNTVARFSLEAALDTADQSPTSWPEPPNVEKIFAARYLKEVLESLGDAGTAMQYRSKYYHETGIIKALKKHSDPCPYLPSKPDRSTACHYQSSSADHVTDPRIITIASRTWADCAQAILKEIEAIRSSTLR